MDENTITTVFKADISQFSSSTQQLNQYIKTVNSEFEVATSSLGKWSDSTDGLKAKITQLNKVLDAEKTKLGDMKKRLEEMEKAGKGNTKEAKNLQIAINNQTAKINKAEKQTDDYTKSLNELEDAGAKTKKELDELTKSQENQGKSAGGVAGKIAKGLGGAALGIAGAAAGAVTGFLALGESTREFRKEQAQLETAFVSAGHSTETMQKTYADFNAVLGDTAKTTEAMQQLAQFTKNEKELTQYTDILTGAYATFGDALPTEGLAEGINHTIQLGEVQGSLADALEWSGVSVDDFNAQLEKCSTEEERNALIQKTLNGLYGEAAEHYKENNKDLIESEKAQTRLTQAMADLGAVAEPIMTMLKTALADLLEVISPFVQLLGEGLTDAFNGVEGGAEKFAEGLTGIVDSLLTMVTNMLPKVIEVVLAIIPTMIETLLGNLPTILQTIIDCITQILNAISEMLPTLIPIIIDAILMIVETILDNIDQIIDAGIKIVLALADGLINALPNLIDKIPILIDKLINAITTNLPKLIKAGIELTLKLSQGLMDAVPQLVGKLPEIIASIVKGLLEGIPDLIDAGIELVKGLFKGMLNPKVIWENVKKVGSNILDGIKKVFKINSPSKVFEDEIGTNLALGIGEGFEDEMGNVTKDMQKSLASMTDDLQVNASGVIQPNNNATPNWVEQLAGIIKNQNITNNYKFDYTFERMETSRLALHKANLEARRIIGG